MWTNWWLTNALSVRFLTWRFLTSTLLHIHQKEKITKCKQDDTCSRFCRITVEYHISYICSLVYTKTTRTYSNFNLKIIYNKFSLFTKLHPLKILFKNHLHVIHSIIPAIYEPQNLLPLGRGEGGAEEGIVGCHGRVNFVPLLFDSPSIVYHLFSTFTWFLDFRI